MSINRTKRKNQENPQNAERYNIQDIQTWHRLAINKLMLQITSEDIRTQILSIIESPKDNHFITSNQPNQFIKLLYESGVIHECPSSDWRIGRKAGEIAEKMALINPKAFIKFHIQWLQKNGITISKENKALMIEQGSGDGTTIKEIANPFYKRPEDMLNDQTISDFCYIIGITKEYLFHPHKILTKLLKDKDDKNIKIFLEILCDLILQKKATVKKMAITESLKDIDFKNLEKDINILKKIIKNPNYYLDINNLSTVCVSKEFPGDTKVEIPEQCRRYFYQLINDPEKFIEQYFIEGGFELDFKDHIDIYMPNTILANFSELENIFPENTKFDVVNSCRSSSHLNDEEYRKFILTICKRLTNGGSIRCDGLIESNSRFNRYKTLQDLEKELGAEYRFLVIAKIQSTESQLNISPSSLLIQKSIKNRDNKNIFYDNETLKAMTDLSADYSYESRENVPVSISFPLRFMEDITPQILLTNAIINKYRNLFRKFETIKFCKNDQKIPLINSRKHFNLKRHIDIAEEVDNHTPPGINIRQSHNFHSTPIVSSHKLSDSLLKEKKKKIIEALSKKDHFIESLTNLTYGKIDIEYNGVNLPDISYFIRKSLKQKPHHAETIFHLHGLGCREEDFIDLIDIKHLDSYNLVAVDLPGFGNSPYPENAQFDNIQDWTSIIDILREKIIEKNKILRTAQIYILGHSMGADFGIAYAANDDHMKHIAGIIPIESNLTIDDAFISSEVIKDNNRANFPSQGMIELTENFAHSLNPEVLAYLNSMQNSSALALFDCSKSMIDYIQSSTEKTKTDFIKSEIGRIGINTLQNDLLYLMLKQIPIRYFHGSRNSRFYKKTLSNLKIPSKEISGSGHFILYRQKTKSTLAKKVSEFVEDCKIQK